MFVLLRKMLTMYIKEKNNFQIRFTQILGLLILKKRKKNNLILEKL